ncbi:alpha/beta hydrolase [Streptomonospora sp. S1-112]|uniref:Alpha/beta hydrolase n=1 Tax=Streptomonospora mangrovi TaxID=2883123 RepID=A0A9X3NG84_9ACTN|nr:alpha/beta hydrolase [Streptomonospora mangrovi]MDA0562987.1 alpha/beta hydrolase [Streptomonospora mangrovi]
MPEPIAQWPGEHVTVAGRRVFVRRDHPPAPGAGLDPGAPAERRRTVYVHGLGGSSTDWTDLMGALCRDCAGEALDLPGFGHSPPPPDGDYTLDSHARTVAALISAGDGPVHLVGNSLGGAVAVRVAAQRPALVRSLTLISPALPDLWPRLVPYQMAGALVPGVGRAVFTLVQRRPPEVRVQDMYDTTFFDPASAPPQRVMEALEAQRLRDTLPHAHTAVLESLRGIVTEYLRRGAGSLWSQARLVRCPTLLLYGTADRFVNPRTAARAARAFRGSRTVLMPRTGHVAMMECPDRVAREVRPFLLSAQARTHAAKPRPAPGMPNPTP